jgi:hypothetical protein
MRVNPTREPSNKEYAMAFDRATPSRQQLFAAYEAGIDMNRYVRIKKIFKHHLASMAITAADIKQMETIDRALERGVTLNEIGNTYVENVDLHGYLSLRSDRHNSPKTTHLEALEAVRILHVSTYSVIRSYSVSHLDIVAFMSELGSLNADEITYMTARSRGISMEDARVLALHPFLPSDMVPKLLDIGVTASELIEASTLDGPNTSVINNRMSYASLRQHARQDGFRLTHEQAMEVARDSHWPHKYVEERRLGVGHGHVKAMEAVEKLRPKPEQKRRRPRTKPQTVWKGI